MTVSVRLDPQGMSRWVSTDDPITATDVGDRCTPEAIGKAVSHLDGVRVTSATVNTSGRTENTPPKFDSIMELPPYIEDLPDFCDVRLERTTPAGHVAEITVWVPLAWNERFLGTGGGGMLTSSPWIEIETFRVVPMPVALRNGFATAMTDGGIRDPRLNAYALDEKTREIDRELLRDWSYRATHDMTVIGKAVTEAIHGVPPRYSYFSGASGGGRQAMAEAQRYPDDYDGIWSVDPAINWTKFVPAGVWPALVMKELGNVVTPAKFEAFRAKAVAADRAVDPAELVGTQTSDGEITELDAEVVRKIWEGPRTADGEFLWYGLHPEAESWGASILQGGLACTTEVDGELVPEPFIIAKDWIGAYLLRDPEWDWRTLTFEQFRELFARSVEEFADFATDDPDLSGLRDSGGKLILTHTTGDEVIFAQGSTDYFRRVHQEMGGQEQVADFARLFMGSGDGHVYVTATSAGATIGGTMSALMRWVEEGVAPDEIPAQGYDMETGKVTLSRTIPAFR
ncbi:tannase/feruloyl esterase family alpha/beta hydrolase [Streptomyces sp. CA-210063]|uniref:tannase/feruloyl esterase family alpha/beta hydrolase n=1 Tax=Streptomyces sp. CA-210063 TaxID=2801029 RepID=UPI00214C68E0|nr:tannase/feruloyl esterase family alpha/beta hydrolase [Streptomyces sp. CA-210063]UUU29458.1 tannase/feruloyl esterase family alpha/beta hydrolase [Streptomyces sp. CA-210063]